MYTILCHSECILLLLFDFLSLFFASRCALREFLKTPRVCRKKRGRMASSEVKNGQSTEVQP